MTILPLYVLLWLRAGLWWEIRIFNELLPYLCMLIYVNVLEMVTEKTIEPREGL